MKSFVMFLGSTAAFATLVATARACDECNAILSQKLMNQCGSTSIQQTELDLQQAIQSDLEAESKDNASGNVKVGANFLKRFSLNAEGATERELYEKVKHQYVKTGKISLSEASVQALMMRSLSPEAIRAWEAVSIARHGNSMVTLQTTGQMDIANGEVVATLSFTPRTSLASRTLTLEGIQLTGAELVEGPSFPLEFSEFSSQSWKIRRIGSLGVSVVATFKEHPAVNKDLPQIAPPVIAEPPMVRGDLHFGETKSRMVEVPDGLYSSADFELVDNGKVRFIGSVAVVTFRSKIDGKSHVVVVARDAVGFEQKIDGGSFVSISGDCKSINHISDINGGSIIVIDCPNAIVHLGKIDGNTRVYVKSAASLTIREVAGESHVYLDKVVQADIQLCHWGAKVFYSTTAPHKGRGDGTIQKVNELPVAPQ